jgi:hypothetical protein
MLLIFSFNSLGYECRSKEIKLDKITHRKAVFKEMRLLERQSLVEGMLFDITAQNFNHSNAVKAAMILNYLINSEVNTDQRAFFKLLETSSDINGQKPKALQLNEVCDIMGKVNELNSKIQ